MSTRSLASNVTTRFIRCLIGKRRMEKALARVDPEKTEVQVHYMPYQLDPSITGTQPLQTYLNNRFGPAFSRMLVPVRAAGKEFGIEFPFDGVSANTLNAHRVLTYTSNKLGWEAQLKVLDAIFDAPFERAKDISDPAVLAACASQGGVAEADVITLLEGDDLKAEVARSISARRNIGGVPNYVIDGKYSISGAQDPETICNVLEDLGVTLLDA